MALIRRNRVSKDKIQKVRNKLILIKKKQAKCINLYIYDVEMQNKIIKSNIKE